MAEEQNNPIEKMIGKEVDRAIGQWGKTMMEPIRKTIERNLQTANVLLGVGITAYLLDLAYRHYVKK
jgi:hypothetical protein